jgi:uncharacterized OB-fold protein
VDAFFWEGVADDRLLLQRCAGCALLIHPPQPMCPRCASLERVTEAAPTRGTVYSWLLSHHPSQPDDEPRLVALIELRGGDDPVRLVSNLREVSAADVAPGMAVEVFFAEVDGVKLPQFRPVSDAEQVAP